MARCDPEVKDVSGRWPISISSKWQERTDSTFTLGIFGLVDDVGPVRGATNRAPRLALQMGEAEVQARAE
jgi:hypothetical protein